MVVPHHKERSYLLLTRAPLYSSEDFLVRLACVRHAASVRSEPGSNSNVLIVARYSNSEFLDLLRIDLRVTGSFLV